MSYGKQQQPGYKQITATEMFPVGAAGSGTVSSTGKVITGAGTTFNSSVRKGGYIRVGNQVRQIRHVFNDGRVDINRAFVPDVAGQAYEYVENGDFTEVGIVPETGTADISTIENDSQTLPQGTPLNWGQRHGSTLGPVIVITAGVTVSVENKL